MPSPHITKFKKLIELKGYTARSFAIAMRIEPSTFWRQLDAGKIPVPTRKSASKLLGISVEELEVYIGLGVPSGVAADAVSDSITLVRRAGKSDSRFVDLVSRLSIVHHAGLVMTVPRAGVPHPNAFAVVIDEDGMEPLLQDGDVVVFVPLGPDGTKMVSDGHIVCLRGQDHRTTIRKIAVRQEDMAVGLALDGGQQPVQWVPQPEWRAMTNVSVAVRTIREHAHPAIGRR